MRRISAAGLGLLAAFVIGAVVTASASAALPEYKTCIKAPEKKGHYTEQTCSASSFTAEAVGKYERAEWNKGKKVSFKGKNNGPLHSNLVNPVACVRREPETGRCLEYGGASTPAEVYIPSECSKEKITGEVTGPKTAIWTVEHKGCKETYYPEPYSEKCSSSGQKAGTVVTDQLESTLINLDGGTGHQRVGIRIKGLGPGGRLTEYQCGPLDPHLEIFGELLAEVRGNLNSSAKTTEIVTKEGPLHLQSDLYEEEAFSEEIGKSYFESAPVPRPVALEANGVLVVQTGVTDDKGESMLIEDN